MLHRNSSAGTAAQKSSKCSLFQRPAIILAMLLLCAVYSYGQKVTWGKSVPCKTDTLKGILYRAVEYGSYSIETGYYIAKCGGIQIGGIPVMGQEKAPIWIPGLFLRRDEVDKNGKLVYKEFQGQYNTGYFTDEHFKKIQMSAVYGLLVVRK